MNSAIKSSLLLAGYTSESQSIDDWLGGEEAFSSQTKRMVEAVQLQIISLLQDPIFVGRLDDRTAEILPRAVVDLKRHSTNPVKSKKHLNYHSCLLSQKLAQEKVEIDDPTINLKCEGIKFRSAMCTDALINADGFSETKIEFKYLNICKWSRRP